MRIEWIIGGVVTVVCAVDGMWMMIGLAVGLVVRLLGRDVLVDG